jgi:hypothetical protein
MIGRIFGVCIAAALILIALYLSRFWPFDWWSRDGLFGVKELRPQGDLLRRWLRGTMFGPYDLLIWTMGGIVVLSILQSLWTKLTTR